MTNPAFRAAVALMGRVVAAEEIADLACTLEQAAAVCTQGEPATLGGLPTLAFHPPGRAANAAILFLHGGFFRFGSPQLYAPVLARLALAAKAPVYAPALRRAPATAFPGALEDACAAYRALSALRPDHRIFLAGDESGGNLALAAAVAALAEGLPRPAALCLLSPWLDLAQQGFSYVECAGSDAHVCKEALDGHARAYLGGADPADPRASPLHAALAGLPPILVQVSAEEILLADGEALIQRARAAGVDATLELWSRVPHARFWQMGELPEADEAIQELGAWMSRRM